MLIQLQFPMTDLRAFKTSGSNRLPAPTWPTPLINREFVRSFGAVRRRRRGGLNGWSAEDHYCDASRAISFPIAKSGNIETDAFTFRLLFNRLFSDGLAMLKHEIGFSCHFDELDSISIDSAISALLQKKVGVRHAQKQAPLGSVAKQLAALYEYSSTLGRGKSIEQMEHVVRWESPTLFVEVFALNAEEFVPEYAKQVPLRSSVKESFLYHWDLVIAGQTYKVIALCCRPDWQNEETYLLQRGLRLYISRLNAEYANLRRILKEIANKTIAPPPRSEDSDVLQSYLVTTIKRISRFEGHLTDIAGLDDEIAGVAKGALERIAPGELSSLRTQIDRLAPRPTVRRRIDSILPLLVVEGDLIMGDNFVNQGVAGAFGSNPQVTNLNQQQNVSQQQIVNLAPVKTELEQLGAHVEAAPASEERTKALTTVEEAKTAAGAGDQSKLLSVLKSAGSFTMTAIKELGLPLLGELLKQKMSS